MLNALDDLRRYRKDFDELFTRGQYNLKPLSSEHVELATHFLMKKLGVNYSDNIHANYVTFIGDDIVENAKTKPQIVQISNGHHWITACLVPGGKAGVTILTMNSFDDSIPCDEHQHKNCKEMEEQLQGIIREMPGYGNVELHRLDVRGQQHDDCCGLATAMNGVSLLKTFCDDYQGKLPIKEGGEFDIEAFKAKLSPNIFYQLDDADSLLVFGDYVASTKAGDFVKKFGGYVLQSFGKDAFEDVVVENQDMEVVFTLKNIFDEEVLAKEKQKNDHNIATLTLLQNLKEIGLQGIINELNKADDFHNKLLKDQELQSIVTKYFKLANQSLFNILLTYIFGSQDTKESLEKKFNKVLDTKLEACSKLFTEREKKRKIAQDPIQVC
jgi:hypothetical protein